jgi:hypothetical protein
LLRTDGDAIEERADFYSLSVTVMTWTTATWTLRWSVRPRSRAVGSEDKPA